jgi:hypothetical protein
VATIQNQTTTERTPMVAAARGFTAESQPRVVAAVSESPSLRDAETLTARAVVESPTMSLLAPSRSNDHQVAKLAAARLGDSKPDAGSPPPSSKSTASAGGAQ